MTQPKVSSLDKRAYAVEEVARTLSVSKATIYEMLKARKIQAHKLGHRTVVLHDDLIAYLNALPAFLPKEADAA